MLHFDSREPEKGIRTSERKRERQREKGEREEKRDRETERERDLCDFIFKSLFLDGKFSFLLFFLKRGMERFHELGRE